MMLTVQEKQKKKKIKLLIKQTKLNNIYEIKLLKNIMMQSVWYDMKNSFVYSFLPLIFQRNRATLMLFCSE